MIYPARFMKGITTNCRLIKLHFVDEKQSILYAQQYINFHLHLGHTYPEQESRVSVSKQQFDHDGV